MSSASSCWSESLFSVIWSWIHRSSDTETCSALCLTMMVSGVANITLYGSFIFYRSFDCAMFSSFSLAVLALVVGRFTITYSPFFETGVCVIDLSPYCFYFAHAVAVRSSALSNITKRLLSMHTRMLCLNCVTSSSTVGAIVVVLSRIGHGCGLVIVRFNCVVPVDAFNCVPYMFVKCCTK